jgi:hypothetical protein
MNAQKQKPFFLQIFAFNRSMYVLAAFVFCAAILVLLFFQLSFYWRLGLALLALGSFYFSVASLFFSWLIYDRSDLYTFQWLQRFLPNTDSRLYNLYSGYTEAGHLLQEKFSDYTITHFDFFDKEVSVTASIQTAQLLSRKLDAKHIHYANWKGAETADVILFMQSLHELREEEQQVACLKTAAQHCTGKIIVAEHLRDGRNMLIYATGAFHFFARQHWLRVFAGANLRVEEEFKITPFVRIFVVGKNNP